MRLKNMEKFCGKYKNAFAGYLKKDTAVRLAEGRKRKRINTYQQLYLYQKRMREIVKSAFGDTGDAKCQGFEITGVVKAESFDIEKVLIRGNDGVCITANVYLPRDGKKKRAAILFACGHAIEGKAFEEYQIAIQNFVKCGFTVLVFDPMGQGERLNYYNPRTGACDVGGSIDEHSYNGNRCWISGIPISNFFLSDAKTALDYLCSREDVDKDRIGMTGNSGGGTQTAMIMLSRDDRIKAFAPATYISSMEEMIKTFQPQDDEQNFYNFMSYGFDYDDIILSVAPKPVAILAVSQDFFPVDGAVETYLKAKKVYKKLKKPENIELIIDKSFHKYTDALAKSAARFFLKHFYNDKTEIDYNYQLFPATSLNVTASGQLKTSGHKTKFLNERLVDIIKDYPAPVADKTAIENVIFKDRQKIFANPKEILKTNRDGIDITFYEIQSYYGLKNIFALYSKGSGYSKIKVCFYDDGNIYAEENFDKIKSATDEKCAVIVPDTSNFGYFKPRQIDNFGVYDRFGLLYTMSHQMFLRGDSLASLRCCEIINIISCIERSFNREIIYRADGNIENLAALCMYCLDKKCFYAGNSFDYKDIAQSYLYKDKNVKPYIIYGILKLCDIKEVKKLTSA